MGQSSKVVLLRPPEDVPTDFYNVQEALGIAYIAAYLRDQGISTEIVDSIVNGWDVEETVRHLLGESFDVLGITLFPTSIAKVSVILRKVMDVS